MGVRRWHNRVVTDLAQTADLTPSTRPPGHSRTGMDADSLRRGIVDHLHYSIGRPAAALRPEHYYRALALAVRDRMQDQQGRDHPDFAGPRPEGHVLSLG